MKTTTMDKLIPGWLLDGAQASDLIVLALSLSLLCGALAFVFRRSGNLPGVFGLWGVIGASVLALPVALLGLSSGGEVECGSLNWSLPLGGFSFGADALSSLFMLPLLLLGPLAALHSRGYLKGHGNGGGEGAYWFFFNLLFASMLLVLCASDGVLFLLAWELMGVSSFALVAFEHEAPATRSAAWKYLVAAHVGAAFLMTAFILLGPCSLPGEPERDAEWLWSALAASFDFSQMALVERPAAFAFAIFVLALIGFGLKAGIFPLHVWLPDAHPAAPAPVSALMSGVMIKLGLYGLLRVVALLGAPSTLWAWVLIALGAATGLFGVISALSQCDLKRLLAYSSVENVGIMVLGFGVGLYGSACGQGAVALLGFGGAFVHILNHSVMKGLLFLCAGSVLKGSGALDLERLGGLLKRMPWTGSTFVVGSAAISGLPPFNGFVGEFLIMLACFEGVLTGTGVMAIPSLIALGALALIGGLAPAVFAKAAGTVFLGEPRSKGAAEAKEASLPMIFSQVLLAVACVGLALVSPRIVAAGVPAIDLVSGIRSLELSRGVITVFNPLFMIGLVSSALLLLLAMTAFLRGRLPRADVERQGPTWDCGYAEPGARMQYGGSSLAQPLRDLFRGLFRPKERVEAPQGSFPKGGFYSSELPDLAERWLFEPLFAAFDWACHKLRPLQSGLLHTYIVMIMLAIVLMTLWAWFEMGGGVRL